MEIFSIHVKLKPGKLINGPAILTSYHKGDDRPLLDRMLTHRGVEHPFLLSREASDAEVLTEGHPYRLYLTNYKSWADLIKDEQMFTDDPKYFEKLNALVNQFPQVNK